LLFYPQKNVVIHKKIMQLNWPALFTVR